jgi:predicted transposase/invertase (TIGR01784 family)
VFQTEIGKLEPTQEETVMEIVTSWMEEGLERGRQEGRQAAQVAIAQQLLLEKMPLETIVRLTGLSLDQVQGLSTTCGGTD